MNLKDQVAVVTGGGGGIGEGICLCLEDMGNLVCFLASDLAKEITGQAINVDGGSQLN